MAWYENSEGQPQNDLLEEIPENAFTKPFPSSLWRVDPSFNDGLPYHEILEDISGANIWGLVPEERIRVYDFTTAQDDFDNNGLTILVPDSCTSRQELNGLWDLTLIHPIDKWGKWKYLNAENVLKVHGQLFRIDKKDLNIDLEQQQITVHANHIFYDLNDELIEKITFENGGNGQQYINFVMTHTMAQTTVLPYRQQYMPYEFEYTSNISTVQPEIEFFNQTVTSALIGSGGMTERYGGEIYRNNFYFSINQKMENSRDNAFFLRYSAEAEAVKETNDYSDFCSELHIYDMNGGAAATIWGNPYTIHHPRYKLYQMNVPVSDETNWQLWKKYYLPKKYYEVRVTELKYNHKYKIYKDLQNFQDLRVGDSGYIFFEEAGILTKQRIIAVEKDEITGDYVSITFQNIPEE